MAFADMFALVALGALCSVDTVSVGQVMISRPIVSCTLGGVLMGAPGAGIVIGAIMELFALETMPFGASRYPEWGSAGVVGSVTYAITGTQAPGGLALALLAGLGTAALGSVSMVWHRRVIARIAGGLREELAAGSAGAVARLHVAGISSDLWRGALVTAAGLILSVVITPRLLAAWRLPFGPSVAVPVMLAVAVGGSALARSVRSASGAPWLLVGGLVLGLVYVVAR